MRVAVIGAGIAGLVAARDVRGAGHEVVVLEKSRGVGGRMAARRVEGTVVDHGLPLLDVPHDGILAE
ncbi:MAG: FAD-dependent oxidoreductase, partial [Miltoncostaeaceae bacterium]